MHVIIWRFRAAPGREAEFERAYGPDGTWARLFRRGPGYEGTELLKSEREPGCYLTIDRWKRRAAFEAFEAFEAEHKADYERMDRECEALCAEEIRLGAFDVVEEPPAEGPGGDGAPPPVREGES